MCARRLLTITEKRIFLNVGRIAILVGWLGTDRSRGFVGHKGRIGRAQAVAWVSSTLSLGHLDLSPRSRSAVPGSAAGSGGEILCRVRFAGNDGSLAAAAVAGHSLGILCCNSADHGRS